MLFHRYHIPSRCAFHTGRGRGLEVQEGLSIFYPFFIFLVMQSKSAVLSLYCVTAPLNIPSRRAFDTGRGGALHFFILFIFLVMQSKSAASSLYCVNLPA